MLMWNINITIAYQHVNCLLTICLKQLPPSAYRYRASRRLYPFSQPIPYGGSRMTIRDIRNRQTNSEYPMAQWARHTNANRYKGLHPGATPK